MKTPKVLTLSLLASLALAGCSAPTDTDGDGTVSAPTPTVTPTEVTNLREAAPTDAVFATTQDAVAAVRAAEDMAGGKAVAVDRDDRQKHWEVTVIKDNDEIEYHVSANGEVAEMQREQADADTVAHLQGAGSLSDAINAAAVEVSDGYLDEAELDEEDGVVRWEMDFDDADGNDYRELVMDAASGKVLETKDYK